MVLTEPSRIFKIISLKLKHTPQLWQTLQQKHEIYRTVEALSMHILTKEVWEGPDILHFEHLPDTLMLLPIQGLNVQ